MEAAAAAYICTYASCHRSSCVSLPLQATSTTSLEVNDFKDKPCIECVAPGVYRLGPPTVRWEDCSFSVVAWSMSPKVASTMLLRTC